jgi:hypothetical protein
VVSPELCPSLLLDEEKESVIAFGILEREFVED